MTEHQSSANELAIERYTELMRRVEVGAYEERASWHYETGTYPDDGVERGIDMLEQMAENQGLKFSHNGTAYTLEPLTEAEKQERA